MNKRKKALSLLLCLLMLFSLTACGSFESRMVKALKKMEELESYHMDMDILVDMEMTVAGENVAMEIEGEMSADVQAEPMIMAGEMEMKIMGVKMSVPVYMSGDDASMAIYYGEDEGESWVKMTQELSQAQMDAEASVSALVNSAESFAEAGEETVKGSAARRYDGVVSGLMTQELAKELSEALQEAGLEMDTSGLTDAEVPSSVWIDKKSGMLVRFDMDMTGMMQGLMDGLMDTVLSQLPGTEELGGTDIGMDMELHEVSVSAVLSGFDQVGPVEIPEEVRKNALDMSGLSSQEMSAVSTARQMIKTGGCSEEMLKTTLASGGFTEEEIAVALEFSRADWDEQAGIAAQFYLTDGVSYDGLITYLTEYDLFTGEQAKNAADNCGADWDEQALLAAGFYMEEYGLSYQGLVTTLMENNLFSEEQARKAADTCGADWNQQALLSAQMLLEYWPYSYEGMKAALLLELFTEEEAIYGADHCEADWMENAVVCVQEYMQQTMDRNVLYQCLIEYEGFTAEEAEYALVQNGL